MDWTSLARLLAPPLHASVSGPMLYLALLALGLVVGVLTGFFGVGGGFLVVPLLNVVLGINYEVAVGSSLSFIIGTSFSGVLRQRQEGNVHFRVAVYLAAGSVAGAVLGDGLQNLLLFGAAGGDTAVFTPIMHSIFILVLIATMWSVRVPKKKRPLKTAETKLLDVSRGFGVPATILTGLIIGTMTGLLGIGGGVILVPILLGLFGLEHRRAAGTSLAVIFATAVAGIVKKGMADIPKVSLPLTLLLLVGSVLGVQLGIFLVRRVGAGDFRRYFVYVLLLAIAMILADLAGMLL